MGGWEAAVAGGCEDASKATFTIKLGGNLPLCLCWQQNSWTKQSTVYSSSERLYANNSARETRYNFSDKAICEVPFKDPTFKDIT